MGHTLYDLGTWNDLLNKEQKHLNIRKTGTSGTFKLRSTVHHSTMKKVKLQGTMREKASIT